MALKYKLIAIDLDGTLLSPTGTVTARTRFAVHQCLAAGYLVCFATGRNFTESRSVLDAVGHYDLAVFVGGAMVIDTRERVTLHRTLMNPELARQLCRFFESRGQVVLALQDTGRAGVDYLITQGIAPDPATLQWLKVTAATVHWEKNLQANAHEHTIRIGIVADDKSAEAIKSELMETFGSRIVSHNILVPAYGVQVVEVFDPAVNKWEGILHLARRHEIDPGEIIAIGDDVNDIPMVSRAGLGVAMGNAIPELRAVAKRVIGSNGDDGLAVFLEELVVTHAVMPQL
ncbi:MAG: Cof-type HAD-IIB family hydrolase [Planctomycetota bacterium]|nr:Cof-type HAD-IIB family hydrolase [Planctomycetota bacterium]